MKKDSSKRSWKISVLNFAVSSKKWIQDHLKTFLFFFTFCFPHLLKVFHKTIAYVAILSLLWSNIVWARVPLRLIEEDFNHSAVRTYVENKMGVVDPSVISGGLIHNIFDDLKSPAGTGLVFRTDPRAEAVFNRFYNKTPLALSGVIQSEDPLPMVFASPAGINVVNPDFKNIPTLTLAAGGVSNTDEGYAYGVDQGAISLKNALVEETGDLKSLALAGRAIQLSESLLFPSNRIDLTAGQHIGTLGGIKDLVHPQAFVADESSKPSLSQAILVDSLSILRSKSLNFRSFDEGAPIYSFGHLESTDEDIHIQAKGDVYIHNLLAARNLRIETTGRVFLGGKTQVGGTTNIKAKTIQIAKDLNSIGKTVLEASDSLDIKGNLTSEGGILFKGKKKINLQGSIATRDVIIGESDGDIFQSGFLYTGKGLQFTGNSFQKIGTILNEGSLLVSTQYDIINTKGGISCLGTSCFRSKLGAVVNRGEMVSEGEMTWDARKSTNYGFVETQNMFKAPQDFTNDQQGRIKSKSLLNPNELLSKNKGSVKLKDDLKINPKTSILKGKIKTEGRLEATGDNLTVEGELKAKRGAQFDLKSFTNKGTFRALGEGVQGTINSFLNDGKAEFSSGNVTFKNTRNKKEGAIRTSGHFILQGDSYENMGNVFTGGVHQATLAGSYKDGGTFYAPSLSFLNAKTINYLKNHQSYVREGVVAATENLTAAEKTTFHLSSNQEKYFFQASSQKDLTFQGEIIRSSAARFPALKYFEIFKETPPELAQDFIEKLRYQSFEAWNEVKPKGSGVVLSAGANLNCKKSKIDPEAGSVSLAAEGNISTDGAKLKAGHFEGNNASLQSKNASLKDTTLTSLFGIASILVKENLDLENTHVLGGQGVEARAKNIKMEESSVKSTQGSARVHAEEKFDAKKSAVKGKTSASISSKDLSAKKMKVKSKGTSSVTAEKSAKIKVLTMKGEQTFIEAGGDLTLSLSSLEGAYNKIKATNIKADSNKFHGETVAEAKEEMTLHNNHSHGTFAARSKKMTLTGKNTGKNLDYKADHLINQGKTHAQNQLTMVGKTFEQLGKTKSDGNAYLEGTEKFVDTSLSKNKAAGTLTVVAENNTGMEGKNKADTAILKMKDADLIKLLNQTEARTTEAHLKEAEIKIDADLALKTNLHLWAKKLENKAKLTGHDFIAHLETTLVNQGSMNFYGKAFLKAKESITNSGDISADQDLGFNTDGTFTHLGSATSRGGTLSVEAGKIVADAKVEIDEVVTQSTFFSTTKTRTARFIIPSFSGKNIQLKSESTIEGRGAKFDAQNDIALAAKGNINLEAVAYAEGDQETTVNLGFLKFSSKTDPRNKFLQTQMNSGGNTKITTSGKLDGRGIKVDAGGTIAIQADQGVDLSSLAAVSVVERWNYNTGIFGQNNHRGFKEDAEFYKSELTSRGGGIFVIAKEGGITAQGMSFQAQDEIRLDARDKVDLGALKATVHYASHDEDQFLGFGSSDDKEGSTQRFKQMQALSNKKIGVFSRKGTIEGDAPFMKAPEIELDGEKGILFKPLEINSHDETHHYENNFNINPGNLELEHKEQHTKTNSRQQIAGGLNANLLKVRTGQGAKATMAVNVSGFKEGDTTDVIADTDELEFTGLKNTYDTTTDSWRVAVSIDVNMTPGASFDISYDKLRKTNYSATVQKFGTFHNLRKGAILRVQEGAQTSINQVTGEKLTAIEDKNAQDEEEQDGLSFGVSVSSTGGGVRFSKKWGKLTKGDQLTSLKIGGGNVEQKTIEHKDREGDTRASIGFGITVDKSGKVSANVQGGVGGKQVGFDVPTSGADFKKLDPTQSLKVPTDLNSLNTLTQGAANLNRTVNDLGVSTGDVGKAINGANQATRTAVQGQQTLDQAKSTLKSGNLGQGFDRAQDTLALVNTTAQTAGVNTGPLGNVIQQTQKAKQTGKNAVDFGEKVSENFKSSTSQNQSSPTSPQATPSKEKVAPAVEDVNPDKAKEKQPAAPQKKKKSKAADRSPASSKPEGEKENDQGTKKDFVSYQLKRLEEKAKAEGKPWGEKEKTKALKEIQSEIGGIEQVTWIEDVASGGAGFGRSLVNGGFKEAGKYLAKKGVDVVKANVQEKVEDLVVEGAEKLGVDSDTARKVTAATQMTTGIMSIAHKSHRPNSHKDMSSTSHRPNEGEASSVVNRQKLSVQLKLEEEGLINNKGHLSEKTLKESTPIQSGTKMKNTKFQEEIQKRGEDVKDWNKHTSNNVTFDKNFPHALEMNPDVKNIEVHFYQNTNKDVLTGLDFKAKVSPERVKGYRSTVQDVLEEHKKINQKKGDQ